MRWFLNVFWDFEKRCQHGKYYILLEIARCEETWLAMSDYVTLVYVLVFIRWCEETWLALSDLCHTICMCLYLFDWFTRTSITMLGLHSAGFRYTFWPSITISSSSWLGELTERTDCESCTAWQSWVLWIKEERLAHSDDYETKMVWKQRQTPKRGWVHNGIEIGGVIKMRQEERKRQSHSYEVLSP